MLHTLKIKNFALIADETVEFDKGFNVLIGETGAGKSLILDALSFVLGDKANKLNIRNGEQKMSVQAVFFEIENSINELLEQNDIEVDDSLILSRTLNVDGRSEARVNGVIVTTSFLKEIAKKIVDIYAQNENIELLNAKNHLAILDSYLPDEILPLKKEIARLLDLYNQINNSISSLGGSDELRLQKMDLLEYQIKEIENFEPKLGEDEELKNEIEKLSHYERVAESVSQSLSYLSKSSDLLLEGSHALSGAERYDKSLSSLMDRVQSSKIEIDDIVDSLKDFDFSFNPDELSRLSKRYDELKLLKKKYGATIEDILEFLARAKEDYDNLLFGQERLKKMQKELEDVKTKLYNECVLLSKTRVKIAEVIERNVLDELSLLGFKNCKFKVNFASLPSIEDATYSQNGFDHIEFLLSANAGQELKSLSKTISGGEMSRFMLALKNVFAKCYNIPTLVFDEVDTGISGEIGKRVAERIALLSIKSQVICITHLPQVCAMADRFIFVEKYVEQQNTFTKIKYLNQPETIEYLATISGAKPTGVAIEYAHELKQVADKYKESLAKSE